MQWATKILSQDEVDALLKGVASGEIDTEEAKGKILSGIRAFDFTSQERIIRGRYARTWNGKRIICETFQEFSFKPYYWSLFDIKYSEMSR